MGLLLRACFSSIDAKGHLIARDVCDKDCEYLAEVMDGIEIDGVRFSASFKDGLMITMEGGDLSAMVTPNYMEKVNVVKQIIHKSPDAKFTASVLNKFVRKSNKILSKEPCNRQKKTPPNIILIREIEDL